MDFTEIFSGMPQGPEAINDNFLKLGQFSYMPVKNVTLLNGAMSDSNGITGSLMKFPNGMGILHIRGWIENIALDAWKRIDVIQLPSNYIAGYQIFDKEDFLKLTNSSKMVRCEYNNDNSRFGITNKSSNLAKGDGFVFETTIYLAKEEG